ATVVTPLLAAPVTGQLFLVSSGSLLPFIDAVFPAPLGLTLSGTPSLSNGLTAAFSGVPDVPLTSLSVTFAGGPSSLLVANSGLCGSSQTAVGTFLAQSGATATSDSTVAVTGTCPPGGASPTGTTTSPSGTTTSPRGTGTTTTAAAAGTQATM